MSWLKMPREFRLLGEIENCTGQINIGPSGDDITLTDLIGTMYLDRHDITLTFKATCDDKYPSKEPSIIFLNNILGRLKDVCNSDGTIKSEFFSWNSDKSIGANLDKVYNYLNKP